MMKKTAWIFPGGSARGVYTAGALYALCEMDIQKPDIIIGCSGSAPTCLCYVTGQKEILKKVWLESLSTKEFVNILRFWKVIDIDYLIDIVIRKNNTPDMEKVVKSPITIYFPLTNPMTGKLEYLSNKMGLDIWEIIKASVSVPIWTNLISVMGIQVNGQFYTDSSPGSRFQLHVKKAIEVGAERVVVFDNWHLDDNPTGFLFTKLFAYMRNSRYRTNQLSYFEEMENFYIPANVEFIRLAPIKKLNMSRLENDNLNARKIFKQGFEDTLNSEPLKKLSSL